MTVATAAKELFDDLLTLEVNIVVKPGMTARKMPDLPHALLDIFSNYDLWLTEKAADLQDEWTKFLASPKGREFRAHPPADSRLVKAGVVTVEIAHSPIYSEDKPIRVAEFSSLREDARIAAEAHRQLLSNKFGDVDPGMGVILTRIFRNCDQIKGILSGRPVEAGATDDAQARAATLHAIGEKGIKRTEAPPSLPLTADEVLVVRKIWEVGTEEVLMQTVAQLDGDVVTRVKTARLAAADLPLQELHKQAVATALEHWQFLVQTLVHFITKLPSFLGL